MCHHHIFLAAIVNIYVIVEMAIPPILGKPATCTISFLFGHQGLHLIGICLSRDIHIVYL
jgi:hypothetical protein